MIITLIIYLLIIGYIIFKAFYTSTFIKFSNNNQKIEKFSDSINSISMPFYINMSQIHLLCIFINLILISFIFLPDVLNNLFSSNIVYCQDHNEEHSRVRNQIQYINETYEISDTNRPYIYHLNYKYIGIHDHLKVFEGLSQDFNDILNKQDILFTDKIFNNVYIHKEMYNKSVDILSLTSNAYKNIMFSYKNNNSLIYYFNEESKESFELFNKILNNKTNNNEDINKNIRGFIGGHQIHDLNAKTIKIFNSLEEVQKISKENYDNLHSQRGINIIMPEKDKIIIKNFDELHNYCNNKLLLTLKKDLSRGEINDLIYGLEMNNSFGRHMAINNDHNYLDQDQINMILNKGFFFKEISRTDGYYEPFNKDSMNGNMLEKYERFIDEKELIEEEIDAFQREAEGF